MSSARLSSPAWLLVGMARSVPGVLTLDEGRLTYRTEEELLLDVPVDAVRNVRFPWYYFDGGVKLTVDGTEHRFSFLKPNGGEDVPEALLDPDARPGAARTLVDGVSDIAWEVQPLAFMHGRRAGKAWKAALTAVVPAPA